MVISNELQLIFELGFLELFVILSIKSRKKVRYLNTVFADTCKDKSAQGLFYVFCACMYCLLVRTYCSFAVLISITVVLKLG